MADLPLGSAVGAMVGGFVWLPDRLCCRPNMWPISWTATDFTSARPHWPVVLHLFENPLKAMSASTIAPFV